MTERNVQGEFAKSSEAAEPQPWRTLLVVLVFLAAVLSALLAVGLLGKDSRSPIAFGASPLPSAVSEPPTSMSAAPSSSPGSMVAEPSISASAAPSGTSTPAASNTGLSEAEAIEIARIAAPAFADGDVRNTQAGPLEEVFPPMREFDWSRDLPPDRWVWTVFLVTESPTDENGAIVTLDYFDGTVYEVSTGFAD